MGCRGREGRRGCQDALIYLPTRPRPHLQRSPGGVGLPGSLAWPPWHLAARRADKRRGGKVIGQDFQPQEHRTSQFEPHHSCENSHFHQSAAKVDGFHRKSHLSRDQGARGRWTRSTVVAGQLSLHTASDTQMCARVPNTVRSQSLGSVWVGPGRMGASFCPSLFLSPVPRGSA